MQLKPYQIKVLNDLNRYLELLNGNGDIEKSYNSLWLEKNVMIGGLTGMPTYKNTIEGVPHVCFKVPTGGGKTYLACNSIKPILNNMSMEQNQVIVWLVPSDTILKQTLRTLKKPQHDYRKQLDIDFSGNVQVLSKEEALNGQGFNPVTIREKVTILVLSYDSFRARNKEGMKVYRQNSNLVNFKDYLHIPDSLEGETDDSAFSVVLKYLHPVIIVDESHHATSELSIDTLKMLDPTFILDLTATPKSNSNLISIVDAVELKKSNMVKLPVIVYNRHTSEEVITDAIDLRNNMEKVAIKEKENGGQYVRPIVLFQAESKGKEDATTYDKLKDKLIKMGIDKDEIAIKIASKDEIKDIELLSEDCKIRYIITINALKEGWDCSFAYILATIANRSSAVEVEQIVGRILRQTNAKKNKENFLNMSYVLTSSDDFLGTVSRVIKGLNMAGFSKKDARVIEAQTVEQPTEMTKEDVYEQTEMDTTLPEGTTQHEEPEQEFLDFNEEKVTADLKAREETKHNKSEAVLEMESLAQKQSAEIEDQLEQSETDVNNGFSFEVQDKMNKYDMVEEFKDSQQIKLPIFYYKTPENMFMSIVDKVPLTEENLLDGFTLKDKNCEINFEAIRDQIASVDVEKANESVKYKWLNTESTSAFKEYFSKLPSEKQVMYCKESIHKRLDKIHSVGSEDLKVYVEKIVDNMDKDTMDAMTSRLNAYIVAIKDKIKGLQTEYKEKRFKELRDTKKIIAVEDYVLPDFITPLEADDRLINSLYSAEYNDMNNYEVDAISQIASLPNVKWWHRNPERKGKESFCINGYFNHFPDFIVCTKSGNIVVIETKGSQLKADAEKKLRLGKMWDAATSDKFSYYMVFDKESIDGGYSYDDFKTKIMPNI